MTREIKPGAVAANAKMELQEYRKSDASLKAVKIRYKHGMRLRDPGKAKTEQLFDQLYAGVVGVYKREKKIHDLEVLLANLLANRKRFFAISLNRNYWKPGPYTQAFYFTIELVKVLNNMGYLKMHKGKGNPDPQYAYNTKIRATDKLLEYMKVLPEEVIEHPESLVELRVPDKNKKNRSKRIWYKDTQETLKIKKRLTHINEVNSQAYIEHDGHRLHPSLIAIFTECWAHHGRLYPKGFWYYQGFDGDERAEIKINGEPVAELDYGGLHIFMLYAQEGIQYSQDPYPCILPNSDPAIRDFMKSTLLPLINAKGKWATVKKTVKKAEYKYWRSTYWNACACITQNLHHDKINPNPNTVKQARKVKAARMARRALKKIGITNAKQIIKAFENAHPLISHYFYTENQVGMKLMNKDGKIALDVVDHFAKQNIVCLPVHDSFIVPAQYRDELKLIMQKTYRKHMKGFRIRVK